MTSTNRADGVMFWMSPDFLQRWTEHRRQYVGEVLIKIKNNIKYVYLNKIMKWILSAYVVPEQ